MRKLLHELRSGVPQLARDAALVYRTLGWQWADARGTRVPDADAIAECVNHLLDEAPASVVDDFWFTITGGAHVHIMHCGDELWGEIVIGPAASGCVKQRRATRKEKRACRAFPSQ